jgi:MFS family permease
MQLTDPERLTKPTGDERSDVIDRSNSFGDEEQTSSEAKGFSPDDGDAPAEPKRLGFVPVLKNRNFLTLWSGQVFSQLADKIYLVLMIALIATHFQSPNQTISGWVSAIMVAFTIPAVLFGSLAGVFVDRWSKKAVLVATNILRGVLVLVVPLLLWMTQGWAPLYNLPVGFYILLGTTFLVSTLTQFFAPAEQAVIPLIVKRQDLLSANSLYTTTMMASLIVGFAVGEPLLALADTLVRKIGLDWDFGKELVVGGSYAIAGLLLLLLRTGENKAEVEGEPPHVLADILDGLLYLKHHRRVRNALIQLVILFSIFAALSVLAVPLAANLGMKPSQFGFLLAAGGVGMASGATILGHWGQHVSHARLSLYGSSGMAVAIGVLALSTHNLWLAFLMTILLGSFAAFVGIPMQTTIQAETPEEMRGKVFGLQNNGVNIALSLPLALAGVAETILGLKSVLFGLAVLAIAGGVLNWYISGTGSTVSSKAEK